MMAAFAMMALAAMALAAMALAMMLMAMLMAAMLMVVMMALLLEEDEVDYQTSVNQLNDVSSRDRTAEASGCQEAKSNQYILKLTPEPPKTLPAAKHPFSKRP